MIRDYLVARNWPSWEPALSCTVVQALRSENGAPEPRKPIAFGSEGIAKHARPAKDAKTAADTLDTTNNYQHFSFAFQTRRIALI